MAYTPVGEAEIADMDGLDGWRVVDGRLTARFAAGSFSAAGELILAFAAEADACDHHPDLALCYPGIVEVQLSTHAVGGLSMHDVELARRCSDIAAQHGAVLAPGGTAGKEP